MSPPTRRTTEATLTEVLTGGRALPRHRHPRPPPREVGWVEVELVAEGVAGSFVPDGEQREDGRLELGPGPTAPYRTRVVVRRPADAAAFSGTVVVEWLNVSSGLDANPDWAFLAPELVRTGVAWVGVSAQCIGVKGGAIAVDAGEGAGDAGVGLKGHDPERYGSLHHPGDAFAYDIYSQVGAAVRVGAPAALGGLRVEQVLAIGESQSAFALTTYIDGVHPDAWVYDGFLVHSRGRSGLPLGEAGKGVTGRRAITGAPQRIRTDLDVPVMIVQTETDLLPVLGYAEARQDDTDLIRLWEIAGTAHADASTLGPFAKMVDCGVPINDGPQRFVLRAALRHLVAWAAGGEAPPEAPRLGDRPRARRRPLPARPRRHGPRRHPPPPGRGAGGRAVGRSGARRHPHVPAAGPDPGVPGRAPGRAVPDGRGLPRRLRGRHRRRRSPPASPWPTTATRSSPTPTPRSSPPETLPKGGSPASARWAT